MNCFWVDIVIMTVAKLAQNREKKKKKLASAINFQTTRTTMNNLNNPSGEGVAKYSIETLIELRSRNLNKLYKKLL